MKIFLDDVRPLPKWMREEGDWTIARSGEECLALIRRVGLHNVKHISFDNDLGSGRMEGHRVLDAIERMIMDMENELSDFPQMTVHSKNPVAAERMLKAIHQLTRRQK